MQVDILQTAQGESLVSQVMARGYARLKFPEPLEHEFRDDYRASTYRWVRMSLLIALSTTIGFAIIDHEVLRASTMVPDFVRFGLQLPMVLICLLTTSKRFYVSWYPVLIQICSPLFGIGTVIMACYATPEHVGLVGARLLLAGFFFYFMIGMRALEALRANMVVAAALGIAIVGGYIPYELGIYVTFSFLCASLIGGCGGYALEYANRSSFLERRLLVEIAALDGLTRLLNRHTFESRVHQTWRRALAEKRSVTIVMVDIDDFKRYNDQYGHLAGDDCLRRVAAAVRGAVACEPGDCIARYGGEEIIAVLIDRTGDEAQTLAQRIVGGVHSLEIPHVASTAGQRVTVSVGVATHRSPLPATYSTVARAADNALYAAKRQGRNRGIVVEAETAVAA
jgi:diguanylate cyclase (GGDEF)-like protein